MRAGLRRIALIWLTRFGPANQDNQFRALRLSTTASGVLKIAGGLPDSGSQMDQLR
jgi:hypothetical protein